VALGADVKLDFDSIIFEASIFGRTLDQTVIRIHSDAYESINEACLRRMRMRSNRSADRATRALAIPERTDIWAWSAMAHRISLCTHEHRRNLGNPGQIGLRFAGPLCGYRPTAPPLSHIA
jgi:hypothetical protein